MAAVLDSEGTKLVRMANQIAMAFRAYPTEAAVGSVAEHINKFWSRMMRDGLVAHAARQADTVEPLVKSALPLIRCTSATTH